MTEHQVRSFEISVLTVALSKEILYHHVTDFDDTTSRHLSSTNQRYQKSTQRPEIR